MTRPPLTFALTGATGFVGGRTLAAALAKGHHVRALTRRPQARREGVDWVPGDLSDVPALRRLCEGADAVIHIAGVVNAPDAAGFREGNAEGTRRMVETAATAGVSRFVQVSSLSAREPGLSLYGGSKAQADAHVMASDRDWVILRPPAVYGPGDMEMLDIYRAAARGIGVAPGEGRFSVIYVDDLAAALVALAESDRGGRQIFEIAGPGAPLSHQDMAALAGRALGRDVKTVRLPLAALKLGAALDTVRGKVTGERPKLSFDRARYIAHPDWTADAGPLLALGIWQPEVEAADGIRRTADWYRAEGLL